MTARRDHSPEARKHRLSPQPYRVTQEAGTEPAFTGALHAHKASGSYVCACCGIDLFSSATKYDSGSGWPGFWDAVGKSVTVHEDRTHGMVREEVRCARCNADLGHLFPDGSRPTGQCYCINSAVLDFEPEAAD